MADTTGKKTPPIDPPGLAPPPPSTRGPTPPEASAAGAQSSLEPAATGASNIQVQDAAAAKQRHSYLRSKKSDHRSKMRANRQSKKQPQQQRNTTTISRDRLPFPSEKFGHTTTDVVNELNQAHAVTTNAATDNENNNNNNRGLQQEFPAEKFNNQTLLTATTATTTNQETQPGAFHHDDTASPPPGAAALPNTPARGPALTGQDNQIMPEPPGHDNQRTLPPLLPSTSPTTDTSTYLVEASLVVPEGSSQLNEDNAEDLERNASTTRRTAAEEPILHIVEAKEAQIQDLLLDRKVRCIFCGLSACVLIQAVVIGVSLAVMLQSSDSDASPQASAALPPMEAPTAAPTARANNIFVREAPTAAPSAAAPDEQTFIPSPAPAQTFTPAPAPEQTFIPAPAPAEPVDEATHNDNGRNTAFIIIVSVSVSLLLASVGMMIALLFCYRRRTVQQATSTQTRSDDHLPADVAVNKRLQAVPI